MLAAPAHLSQAARDVFDRLAKQLADGPTQHIPDALLVDLLTQYAEAHAVRELATRQLATDGSLFAVSPNGVKYPAPAFKIIQQAENCMNRVFRCLGFNGQAERPLTPLNLDDD